MSFFKNTIQNWGREGKPWKEWKGEGWFGNSSWGFTELYPFRERDTEESLPQVHRMLSSSWRCFREDFKINWKFPFISSFCRAMKPLLYVQLHVRDVENRSPHSQMGTGYLQQQFSAWLLQLSILAIPKGWVWLSHSVSMRDPFTYWQLGHGSGQRQLCSCCTSFPRKKKGHEEGIGGKK